MNNNKVIRYESIITDFFLLSVFAKVFCGSDD